MKTILFTPAFAFLFLLESPVTGIKHNPGTLPRTTAVSGCPMVSDLQASYSNNYLSITWDGSAYKYLYGGEFWACGGFSDSTYNDFANVYYVCPGSHGTVGIVPHCSDGSYSAPDYTTF